MDNLTTIIDRYVAVWNEPDPDMRRRRIASIWTPNGTTCYRLLDAHGHEAIESRVTASWDRWLREGKYVFQPVKTVSCRQAIKFDFAMLATGDGKVEAGGLCYLLLDGDGRIVHDYQFNPSANDAVDLAEKYLRSCSEPDAERRRASIAALWAENCAFFSESAEAQGLDELAKETDAANRARAAQDLALSPPERSQHHHNVAHVAWSVAPRGGGAPTSKTSTLLVLDEIGRIASAYQFNEPSTVTTRPSMVRLPV
jgi:hypothetical protein